MGLIVSYEPQMDWYSVSSEGITHKKKGPQPDEPFDKSAPPQAYHVYFSTSKKKWMCPCEAYRFSRFTKHCKHILKVLEYRKEKYGVQNDDC
jgi:hypothetical protein